MDKKCDDCVKDKDCHPHGSGQVNTRLLASTCPDYAIREDK